MEALKFEHLPKLVATLTNEVKELKTLFLNRVEQQSEIEIPIRLNDIIALTGLTKPTLYRYVQRCEIPFHKKNNRLYFFKSEIIDWIKTGKQKTLKEIEVDVDELLSNKK